MFALTKYKTVIEHKGDHPWVIDTKHTKLESNQRQWQKGGATLVRGRHTKDERTRKNKGEKKNKWHLKFGWSLKYMKAVDAIELEFGLTHHVSSVKIRIITLRLRAHCLQKYEHFLVSRNPFYVYR